MNYTHIKVRESILAVLNSYPFTILLAILIAVECLDLVSEVMIEHEITETMVEDNLRIRNFVMKLKTSSISQSARIIIDHILIVSNNIMNVYNVRDVSIPCNNFTQTTLTHQPSFTLNFSNDQLGIYCGIPGNRGHLDLTTLSQRTDLNLQNIGLGVRIFGLINITFMACETLLRILCTGKKFFRRKLDIFDAFVVFTSFILDYSFYSEEFTTSSIIIMLLLPWRILRIVNSLILAINAKHTLQVKTLKQERNTFEDKSLTLTADLKECKYFAEKLEKLCRQKGATEQEVKMCKNEKRAPMALAAISTLASMMLMGTPLARNKRASMISLAKSNVTDENKNESEETPKQGNLCTPRLATDGRRSISTPNLMRNLSIPNSSAPFILPTASFYTPLYIMTPVHSTQHMFFPENFDLQSARRSLSAAAVRTPMDLFDSGGEIPEILVTSPR